MWLFNLANKKENEHKTLNFTLKSSWTEMQKSQTFLDCPPEKWQGENLCHSTSSTKWLHFFSGTRFPGGVHVCWMRFPNLFPQAALPTCLQALKYVLLGPISHTSSPLPAPSLKHTPHRAKPKTPFQSLSYSVHFPVYPKPSPPSLYFQLSWKKPTAWGSTQLLYLCFPSL